MTYLKLVCQKVVYQMKFQQMADCDFGGVCRDTVTNYFFILTKHFI